MSNTPCGLTGRVLGAVGRSVHWLAGLRGGLLVSFMRNRRSEFRLGYSKSGKLPILTMIETT